MAMKFILTVLFLVAYSLFSNAQTSFKKIDFTNSKTGAPDYCFAYVYSFTDAEGNRDSIDVLIYRQIFEELHCTDSTITLICKSAATESEVYLKNNAAYGINTSDKRYVMSVYSDKKGKKSATIIWPFIGISKSEKTYYIFSGSYDNNGNILDKYIALHK